MPSGLAADASQRDTEGITAHDSDADALPQPSWLATIVCGLEDAVPQLADELSGRLTINAGGLNCNGLEIVLGCNFRVF